MKAYDGAQPTVGRIVHYYSETADEGLNQKPHAALIVHVYEQPDCYVRLKVFGRLKPEYDLTVDANFSLQPRPGHWTWPPMSGRRP